jgi:hypothetical protein
MAYNTILTRRTIFASLLAIGVAGGAQAGGVGDVVGGGGATLTGGGDDQQITHTLGGAGGGGGAVVQSGRLATFSGSDGDGPRWNCGAPTADGGGDREAWLTDGGDNAQVMYSGPAPARQAHVEHSMQLQY